MLREMQFVSSVSVHRIQVSIAGWSPLGNSYSITTMSSTRARGFLQLGMKGEFVFFGFFVYFSLVIWLTHFDMWKN